MELIIGGAYQGKLDYAKEKYGLCDNEIAFCDSCEIDFSKKCIYSLEKFSLSCVKNELEPKDYMLEHRQEWKDSIIIASDISCGIVPVDTELRLWREAHGRMLNYLASEAESVTRLFCGISEKIK